MHEFKTLRVSSCVHSNKEFISYVASSTHIIVCAELHYSNMLGTTFLVVCTLYILLTVFTVVELKRLGHCNFNTSKTLPLKTVENN